MGDTGTFALRVAERLRRIDKEMERGRRLARSLRLLVDTGIPENSAATRETRSDLIASISEIRALAAHLHRAAETEAPTTNVSEG
jgi:hypothetical protein